MGANSSKNPSENSEVITFDSASNWKVHLEESKSTNKLMVIDFFACWCGPSSRMNSTMKAFATEFPDVEFIKIDIEALAGVAEEFEIEATPTFVLMKNGKELCRIVGTNRDKLEEKIYEHRL